MEKQENKKRHSNWVKQQLHKQNLSASRVRQVPTKQEIMALVAIVLQLEQGLIYHTTPSLDMKNFYQKHGNDTLAEMGFDDLDFFVLANIFVNLLDLELNNKEGFKHEDTPYVIAEQLYVTLNNKGQL